MSDIFSTNLSTSQGNEIFKGFFENSLRSGEGIIGIRAALGLNDTSRTEKQSLALAELALGIRKNAAVIFGDKNGAKFATLSDEELVNKFIGACYRATLPSDRAARLDEALYPDLGANRNAALEVMANLSINSLVRLSGGALTLGKADDRDTSSMSYLQAIKLGLKVTNFKEGGVIIESPSVRVPASSPVTLVGKRLAVPSEPSSSIQSPQNFNTPALPRREPSDLTPRGGNMRPTKASAQPPVGEAKPATTQTPGATSEKSQSTRTIPYIEDKDMFKELNLSGIYRKGTETDPKIQALWESCGFVLDQKHPSEHQRKMDALKTWYSNGRSLARTLDFLSTATHFSPKFGMDTSRDPITLEFNDAAKKNLYNGLVALELEKKGITITDEKGGPVSFWDLRKAGFEFFLSGNMYVSYYGTDGKVHGQIIPDKSKAIITHDSKAQSFELKVS